MVTLTDVTVSGLFCRLVLQIYLSNDFNIMSKTSADFLNQLHQRAVGHLRFIKGFASGLIGQVTITVGVVKRKRDVLGSTKSRGGLYSLYVRCLLHQRLVLLGLVTSFRIRMALGIQLRKTSTLRSWISRQKGVIVRQSEHVFGSSREKFGVIQGVRMDGSHERTIAFVIGGVVFPVLDIPVVV